MPEKVRIDIASEFSTETEGARSCQWCDAEHRQIAGPPLSRRSLHLVGLPLDPETAEAVRRTNRESEPHLLRANVSWSSHTMRDFRILESKLAGDPGPIPDFLVRRAP
jgi:hypothetical protein